MNNCTPDFSQTRKQDVKPGITAIWTGDKLRFYARMELSSTKQSLSAIGGLMFGVILAQDCTRLTRGCTEDLNWTPPDHIGSSQNNYWRIFSQIDSLLILVVK